tara:strand:+ start:188 stop:1156 length:969 start_codon:yes stop_codon:yes gene_type:complete
MQSTNILLASLSLFIFSCSTVQPPPVKEINPNTPIISPTISDNDIHVLKRKVAIGRFSNETNYGKSIFSDGSNDIGKKASDILAARLVSSEKFILLERDSDDLAIIDRELDLNNLENLKIPADYLILGSVSEFGRKVEGDVKIFSRDKVQTAYAKVNIRLVDVSNGLVIYSEEGAGEAYLESGTVLGSGTRTGYDFTLDDKAISAAISKLVNNIIENLSEKPWRSYILDVADNNITISGGSSQGIQLGDNFNVVKKGKKVRNPQTGIDIELPGEIIGKIKIIATYGESLNDELSVGTFESTNDAVINIDNLADYFVQEVLTD